MSGVDVVVPCYNYARYLETCVESLLGQDGVDVRVLVIDDASTDDTPEVGRLLAQRDRRVEFRRHALNRGHIATYNEGLLEWASARYSLLLSADDVLAPGALSRASRLMDRHPEVGMTYGMALIVVDDETPRPPATSPEGDAHRVIPGAAFLEYCFDHANPVPTPSAVVRTEVQQRVGGYRKEYPHAGDFEMWMRFAAEAPVGVVNAVQAHYRWHSANMSRGHYGKLTGDLPELKEVRDSGLRAYAAKFAGADRWRETARRRLAHESVSSASAAFNDGHIDACEARLQFAAEVYPPIRRSPHWWRVAAKRAAGPSAWRRLRPAINRLRGRPTNSTLEALLWRGLKIGWWPE